VVTANGETIQVLSIKIDPENSRVLIIKLADSFAFDDVILVSYSGNNITSANGSVLQTFIDQEVENNLEIVYSIPGRLQAEDYFNQSGIQLENTTDAGGGQNIGFLDVGDFLDYNIDVQQSGSYSVDIRTAALSEVGGIKMELIDQADQAEDLGTFTFPSTGGWQSWQTSTEALNLPAGQFVLRVTITQPLFNINYFDFNFLTATIDESIFKDVKLSPNPSRDFITLVANLENATTLKMQILDEGGRLVTQKVIPKATSISEMLNVSNWNDGVYLIRLIDHTKIVYASKIIVGF